MAVMRAHRGSRCVCILLLPFPHQPSPHNLILPFEDDVDRLAICDVLLLKNALTKTMFRVAVEHGNGPLHDDRAMVEFFIDEMHGTTGDLNAVSKRLLLRFNAGK